MPASSARHHPARSRSHALRGTPETFRPDADTRAWLAAEAARRGVSKTDVILAALRRERAASARRAGAAATLEVPRTA